MTAREIFHAVYDRFDGKAPMTGSEVNLDAIVVTVLEVLADNDIVHVNIDGLMDEMMVELGE